MHQFQFRKGKKSEIFYLYIYKIERVKISMIISSQKAKIKQNFPNFKDIPQLFL